MTSPHTAKTTGAVLDDGTLIDMLHDRAGKKTSLVSYRDGVATEHGSVKRSGLPDLAPYSAMNPLIENNVVRFPSRPEPYASDAALVHDVRSFIHRYVDLSETFELIAAYYILFSWVYDAFNELPYLRVRGDYGTGKTRFLGIVGSIAYKPIFGSGASTVSPIFHLLEQFGGTLVIDEADFRFSDEKADLVKILNNGNVRGFPVLRAIAHKNGEFSPRAFHVYGPKIMASRGTYDDKALESRFITEDMGNRPLRNDIPINLPAEHDAEALHLRNMLLMYRFRHRSSLSANAGLIDRSIDARLNQVFVPLLSVIDDAAVREAVMEKAREHHAQRRSERAESIEARVLTILRHSFTSVSGVGVAVGDITSLFVAHYSADVSRPMTPRWMGAIIRTKLGLSTQKSNGRFVVPTSEQAKLVRLYDKYDVSEEDVALLEEKLPDDVVWEPTDGGDVGTLGTLR
jgi:hypothetical protein